MKVLDNKEDFIMKLKDTGLTVQDIKDKVNKYMIETYERFDFLAETAEGMYIYDENGTPYLDFYAGIAVNNAGNRNPKVVENKYKGISLRISVFYFFILIIESMFYSWSNNFILTVIIKYVISLCVSVFVLRMATKERIVMAYY